MFPFPEKKKSGKSSDKLTILLKELIMIHVMSVSILLGPVRPMKTIFVLCKLLASTQNCHLVNNKHKQTSIFHVRFVLKTA